MSTTPRILYTDLDGTLLGKGGSLFDTEAGEFTTSGAEALGLCRSHGVKLTFVSGRSVNMLREDARIMSVDSYIGEAGCVIVRDGGSYIRNNCGPFGQSGKLSVYEEIAATGAPELLMEEYKGSLVYHSPWYLNHQYSHLMRGYIDTAAATELLKQNGFGELKMVDNGIIEDRGYNMEVPELHAYHLIPRQAGKGTAIARHLKMEGLTRADAFACGDSAQDLEMAAEVSTLYLMSNYLSNGLEAEGILKEYDNVVIVDASMVEGFLLAVRQALGV